jgi:hypothetical protein
MHFVGIHPKFKWVKPLRRESLGFRYRVGFNREAIQEHGSGWSWCSPTGALTRITGVSAGFCTTLVHI